MSIQKKYQETDFKGKANAAGTSIKNTFNSVKESEKTKSVVSNTKKGFFSFVNKVKELMSDPVPIERDEELDPGHSASEILDSPGLVIFPF